MTFMPWSSDLMLGIPLIDEQHKCLVDLINALHEELSHVMPDRNRIGEVLEGLVDYTHNHFIIEEVEFQKHGYPDTEEHLKEHGQFTSKAMDWLMRFEDGEDVDLEAMEFLKVWLVHHICEEDRAYVPFMKAAFAKHKVADNALESVL